MTSPVRRNPPLSRTMSVPLPELTLPPAMTFSFAFCGSLASMIPACRRSQESPAVSVNALARFENDEGRVASLRERRRRPRIDLPAHRDLEGCRVRVRAASPGPGRRSVVLGSLDVTRGRELHRLRRCNDERRALRRVQRRCARPGTRLEHSVSRVVRLRPRPLNRERAALGRVETQPVGFGHGDLLCRVLRRCRESNVREGRVGGADERETADHGDSDRNDRTGDIRERRERARRTGRIDGRRARDRRSGGAHGKSARESRTEHQVDRAVQDLRAWHRSLPVEPATRFPL